MVRTNKEIATKNENERHEDELLTVKQAAQFLAVANSTMRRWEQEGRLVPERRTEGNHRRYTKRQLVAFFWSAPERTNPVIRTGAHAEVRVEDLAKLEERDPAEVLERYGPGRIRGGEEWLPTSAVLGMVLGCPIRVVARGHVAIDQDIARRIAQACRRQMVDLTMIKLDSTQETVEVFETQLRRQAYAGAIGAVMLPAEVGPAPWIMHGVVKVCRRFGVKIELIP